MNPTDPSANRPSPDDHIGDQNVERLVNGVYQPEPLDSVFVQRVRQRVESEVMRQQRGDVALPARVTTVHPATWSMLGLAAVAFVLLGGYFLTRSSSDQADDPGYYVDGELVWIDGQAFRPAVQPQPRTTGGLDNPRGHEATVATEPLPARRIGDSGLTPRPRAAARTQPSVAVGDTIVTERGQRRRVELPDGSVMYVNQHTTVRVQQNRRVAVTAGEVFVDVSPADQHAGAKFVVETPNREVTAVGTKFVVHVRESETDVAVAQGKVNVSGVEPTLLAGQQLRVPNKAGAAEAPITPLPRSSHVLHWTRDLMAAAESPLVPGSDHRGGALVAVDPHGQQAKLALRMYHVDVHVEDGFARTTIDQTYFNHLNSRLEGTFYFPLPADASISRLAMYVNGKLMEGGMAERDHARNVFETIKHRALDPALLEWIDGSTFKMRVFPLEGRQEKRIVLSYTQRLGNHYNRTDYRFPAGSGLNVVRNWSLRLHVVDGERMRWECSSHDLKASTAGGDLTLTSAAADVSPDRDIVLALFDNAPGVTPGDTPDDTNTAAAADDDEHDDDDEHAGPRARFSTFVHDRARYTLLRFRPELPAVERRPRRDWVFLFDADGSRDPLLARVQVDIIKTLLQNAEPDDTFAVITAATRVRTVAPQPWPVNDANIEAAIKALDQTQLIGALDLSKTLAACQEVSRTLANPIIVHVGSAIPILGERANDKLLEQLPPKTPYVGVGVGRRWNRTFMKAAASRTGGYFTQVNPDEVTGWRAFELLAILNSPRLLDLRVTAEPDQAKFYNYSDSAADGEEICAIVRQEAEQPEIGAVTVTGSLDGVPFRQTIPAEQIEDGAGYLPRIWAKLAIDEMVTRDAEAHKAKIIELSKAMYVMSPFTSLLVLENDAMYSQYNVDRGRQDHWALYPCPAVVDVVHEPILGPDPPMTQQVTSETAPRPSREDVLETLLIRAIEATANTRSRGETIREHFLWTGEPSRTGRITKGLPVVRSQNRLFRSAPSDPFGESPFGGGPFGGDPFDNNQGLNPTGFFEFLEPRFDATPWRLVMMATPRVIIQEEEEELLGVFLDVNDNGLGANADFDSLIELISSTISPDTWDEVGGPGTIEAFPSQLSLVISQTQSLAEQPEFVSDFLGTRAFPVGDLVIPVAPRDNVFYHTMTTVDDSRAGRNFAITYPTADTWEALARRRRKYVAVNFGPAAAPEKAVTLAGLAEQASFNYRDQPLKEVIDDIRLRYDIPIIIDTQALADADQDIDTPVTIRLNEISLRSAIRLLMHELDLTFIIKDGVMRITTPMQLHRELLPRAHWCSEPLLMLPVRSAAQRATATNQRDTSSRSTRHGHDPRTVDRISAHFRKRWEESVAPATLLYPTVGAAADENESRQLVTFARAITTTRADAMATLEAEADLGARPKNGEIDVEARALIEAARREGWHRVTRRDDTGRLLWQLTVDGQGRFRQTRQTPYGLSETVVCDGVSLRHLYPELGLGTTRSVSRFHRSELVKLMPWLVPPSEELAIGADVRLVGPRVIAIAPHGVDATLDNHGEPRRHHRVHLEFSESGRLAARHLVEMPSGKTVLRVAFGDDGVIRWFDVDDELRHECTIARDSTNAPNLEPQLADLVLLPMPIRARDHVYKMAAVAPNAGHDQPPATADALQTIIADDNRARRHDPAYWSQDDALRLLCSILGQDSEETRNVIGRRFFAKGDRRLGFYTLLAATGQLWDVDKAVVLSDGTAVRMSPLADHPNSELASYLDSHLRVAPLETQPDAFNNSVTGIAFSSQGLYAGGSFTTADGNSANRTAFWNGAEWSALGSGLNAPVYTLIVVDTILYAGGEFTTAGGEPASRIAMWTDSTWSALGSGLSDFVSSMAFLDTALYVVGGFKLSGPDTVNYVAKWNGSSWELLGGGLKATTQTISTLSDQIIVGGQFANETNVIKSLVLQYDDINWIGVDEITNGYGVNNSIYALAVSESDIYIGGIFTEVGEISAQNVARWDGANWHALGSGVNDEVYALASYNGNIYAGGYFTMAGGVSVSFIAKWSGSSWSALGSGLDDAPFALGANSSGVYAGGYFTMAGGKTISNIAHWDGDEWFALGSGLNEGVEAIAVNDSLVFAGGGFTMAGGTTANRIAKWNGSSWAALGDGLNDYVYTIEINENSVYVGGGFTAAGDSAANYIAKWDGSSWSPLAGGLSDAALSITTIGNNIYAGGWFSTANSETVNNIASWDGASWDALGSGLNGDVLAIGASGKLLYTGGFFNLAGGKTSINFARYKTENNQPLTFDLLIPLQNDTLNDIATPVNFIWQSSDDVDGDLLTYSLHIAGGTNLDTTINSITDTSYIFNGSTVFEQLSEYHWYVIAYDGELTTSSADTFVLYTPINEPPMVFNLLMPLNGDSLDETSTPVQFTWNKSIDPEGGPVSYDITILNPLGPDTTISAITDTTLLFDGSLFFAHGAGYEWWVFASDGEFTTSSADTFTFYTPVIVGISGGSIGTPTSYNLKQNYPNPFNPSTTINYQLPMNSNIRLEIFNILGQRVRVLIDTYQNAGYHQIVWDGKNISGEQMPSGIYFYRLSSAGYSKFMKMIMLK